MDTWIQFLSFLQKTKVRELLEPAIPGMDGHLEEFSEAWRTFAKALRLAAEGKACTQADAAEWKHKYELERERNMKLEHKVLSPEEHHCDLPSERNEGLSNQEDATYQAIGQTLKCLLLHIKVDLVVTLGGDGTVLWGTSLFKGLVPPVIASSLGSLGFMTPFYSEHYKESLDAILQGPIIITLRHRLQCHVIRESAKHELETDELTLVLNESMTKCDNYRTLKNCVKRFFVVFAVKWSHEAQ
ncbi:hypothetical protein Nepgr_032576 [Nepenthes gracilis]|uniref:NAD(+) kinase n=1 Tax=Nepenthes gracilis TaxID=150966 RepID=A0AAD3Y658_NEPGR|nr:hypothetical protein Nepgr_032576 [Nepenthes gracilis]